MNKGQETCMFDWEDGGGGARGHTQWRTNQQLPPLFIKTSAFDLGHHEHSVPGGVFSACLYVYLAEMQ